VLLVSHDEVGLLHTSCIQLTHSLKEWLFFITLKSRLVSTLDPL
jgi:hypothetical protein